MSRVLVDSSVWIAFFKGSEEARVLLSLLDANQVCTNDLVLAEIIPYLNHRKEKALVKLLNSLERVHLEIDWSGIIEIQTKNLKNGINRVGIPDLIIAQHAVQKHLRLLSLDKHFELMKEDIGLNLVERD